MPDFRLISPGDPVSISAADYNAIADATREQRQNGVGFDAVSGSSDFAVSGGRCVWVVNTTDEDREMGEVLGIGGLYFTDETQKAPETDLEWNDLKCYRQLYKGVSTIRDETDQRASSLSWGKYGLCAETIPKGGVGRVVISGAAYCKLKIVSDGTIMHSFHTRADIDPDNPRNLRTYPGGTAQILSKSDSGYESNIGDAWVLLGCNPITRYYGKMADTETVTMDKPGHFWVYKYVLYKGWVPALDDREGGNPLYLPVYAGYTLRNAVTYNKWICAAWNPRAFRLEVEAYQCV